MNKPERSGRRFSSPKQASSKQTSEATSQQIVKRSTDQANQEQQALALINGGKLNEAESLYRELIEAGSKSHTAHGNLGVILKMKGDLENAIMYFKKAIQFNPNFPDAHNNLGVSLQEQGDITAASTSYKTAIQLKQDYPEAHYNLGNALQDQGDLSAAIASYNTAIKLKKNYPEAHYNLGNALQKKGDLSAAMTSYQTALELRFSYPDAHNNLGVALKDKDHLTAAITSFNNAIKLKPNFPDAHYNLGNALLEQGDVAAAFDSFNTALKIDPNYPDAHWNASLIMLLDGDYSNGWGQYEWRFNRKKGTSKLHALPKCNQWNGNFGRKTTSQLLLVAEQGLGDTLQFMRYAIALRDQGVRISLCAQTQLHSLIKTSGIHHSPLTPEQASQVTEGEWIPLLSVPRSLEVSPENPIITEPYIKTTEELVNKWAGILSTQERPIIGINWQGNPKAETTGLRGRSLRLETFAPIAEQTSASLLSLQKGFGSEQLETCSFKHRFVSCQDQVNEAWDFLETAAIIANCDLVITSDTSVAHLAGGMGKTTWLLLKNIPDWRWGLEGDTTFWYPSMRLFRQQQRGNWDEVLERVVEALQQHFKDSSTPQQALKAHQDAIKPKPLQDILAPISLGELIDKITILQIKTKQLQGKALDNVREELKALNTTLNNLQLNIDPKLIRRLEEVNQELWQIEDAIRDHERQKSFGDAFIQLARSIYQRNDCRAEIKKEINTTYGSTLVEEKTYQQF